jgi:hypothetical protein
LHHLQQRQFELPLKVLELNRNGRLAEVQFLRRTGYAPGGHYAVKNTQLVEGVLHGMNWNGLITELNDYDNEVV